VYNLLYISCSVDIGSCFQGHTLLVSHYGGDTLHILGYFNLLKLPGMRGRGIKENDGGEIPP
jgi:hypothetical protein